jgi:hypothetical protein
VILILHVPTTWTFIVPGQNNSDECTIVEANVRSGVKHLVDTPTIIFTLQRYTKMTSFKGLFDCCGH